MKQSRTDRGRQSTVSGKSMSAEQTKTVPHQCRADSTSPVQNRQNSMSGQSSTVSDCSLQRQDAASFKKKKKPKSFALARNIFATTRISKQKEGGAVQRLLAAAEFILAAVNLFAITDSSDYSLQRK